MDNSVPDRRPYAPPPRHPGGELGAQLEARARNPELFPPYPRPSQAGKWAAAWRVGLVLGAVVYAGLSWVFKF